MQQWMTMLSMKAFYVKHKVNPLFRNHYSLDVDDFDVERSCVSIQGQASEKLLVFMVYVFLIALFRHGRLLYRYIILHQSAWHFASDGCAVLLLAMFHPRRSLSQDWVKLMWGLKCCKGANCNFLLVSE